MTYKKQLEPRSERAGLFSQEKSLALALKELRNPKLSIKRSTRGYTLLYENKPVNPAISPKRRQEFDDLLHLVHSRYVRYLAQIILQKENFDFISLNETKDSVKITFRKSDVQQEIVFTCSLTRWLVEVEILNNTKDSEFPFLAGIEALIGKSV